ARSRGPARPPGGRWPGSLMTAAASRPGVAGARRSPRQARDTLIEAAQTLCEVLIAKTRGNAAQALPAPSASVTYGGAGLAYGLMRLARAREDPELVALADLWSVRAGACGRQDRAFYNAELEVN